METKSRAGSHLPAARQAEAMGKTSVTIRRGLELQPPRTAGLAAVQEQGRRGVAAAAREERALARCTELGERPRTRDGRRHSEVSARIPVQSPGRMCSGRRQRRPP